MDSSLIINGAATHYYAKDLNEDDAITPRNYDMMLNDFRRSPRALQIMSTIPHSTYVSSMMYYNKCLGKAIRGEISSKEASDEWLGYVEALTSPSSDCRNVDRVWKIV